MTPALFHAVVRVADARTSDADLLTRFVQSRDGLAFEELVRRHGALVWSVCRQLLPHHADAEDAFQAVFLALIQGAGNIRTGQALPAWLHGVAVRVAEKTKRTAGRRRQREARAAVVEAGQPVPDTAWAALMTAVHEEVQRLPDQERTAFVLCDLEGIRQPDAAARLGWPLGTLSGRLCKARQRLIDQLNRRGIVPGVLAIGGLAGSASELPAALTAKVSSFPAALADGISSTVAALAHGLVGGSTMRTKVLLAALLVAGAVGLTGASMVFSQADAQVNPTKATGGAGIGIPGPAGKPGTGFGGQAGGPALAPPGGVQGGVGGFDPRQGGPGGGMMPGSTGSSATIIAPSAATTWDYKFIDLKSDERDAFEKEIKQAGTQGWEFCGSERLRKANEGAQLVLVFKKRHGGEFNPMGTPAGMGGPSGPRPGMGSGPRPGVFGGPPATNLDQGLLGAGAVDQGEFVTGVFKLRNVAANELATLLTAPQGFYAKKGITVVAEPVSNTLLVKASPEIFPQLKKTIEDIDTLPDTRPVPAGPGMRPGNPGGATPPGPAPLGPGGMPPPSGATAASGGIVNTGTTVGLTPAGTFTGKLTVVKLKHANAPDLTVVLKQVFPAVEITPESRTNQLIVRASQEQLLEVTKLIAELDVVEGPGM